MTPPKKRSSSPRQSAKRQRWTIVRVILSAKGGEEVSEPPGRDLLVAGSHTFAALAAGIDSAFARWDLSHLHEFRLSGGRTIVMPDPEGFDDDDEGLDEGKLTFGEAGLLTGATFEYLFDLGDEWQHDCTVLRTDVDPVEEFGHSGPGIVPVFGWGAIPDQYGRTSPDEVDDDEDGDE